MCRSEESMGIYTLRLLIHGILLVGIMYITLDTDDYKLLMSNAFIYLLPFTLEFNKRSLSNDYYPKRYKLGMYTVAITLFVIFAVMLLNFLGLKLCSMNMILISLKIVLTCIYFSVGFIVLLDWYFLKDSSETIEMAESAGRESVREKQLATNDRQEKRQLKQKEDYKKHVSKMSQKKYGKK